MDIIEHNRYQNAIKILKNGELIESELGGPAIEQKKKKKMIKVSLSGIHPVSRYVTCCSAQPSE